MYVGHVVNNRMSQELKPAEPADVDRDAVMAMGDCRNCGPHSLATFKVEDATIIVQCASCDYERREPVMENEDGEHIVDFDNIEVSGLERRAA